MIQMDIRDDFDLRRLNKRYNDDLDTMNYILTQKTDTHFLCSFYEIYHELSMYELFLNKAEDKSSEYLYKSVNANNALYRLANNKGKEITLSYDGIPETALEGCVCLNHIVPWNFPDHFSMTLLAREKAYLDEMLNFNTDLFDPEKAGLSGPPYYNRYIKMFIGFFRNKDQANVLKEMAACAKEIKDYAEDRGKDVNDNYSYFTISLFKAILAQDVKTANQLLERRILIYKKSYAEKLTNPLSLYPYHLLGWCALLNDIGMEITIQSDYLPEFLVKGTFTKEKWLWPMG